jgi:nucleotide-binding universal stress UspA family protein
MFRKVLLAIDGSEPSHRAAVTAGELATELGSEVVVLHVHETEVIYEGAFELQTMKEAAALVDSAVRTLKDKGVSARGELVTSVFGRAARVILEVADHEGADVIVMGSRGLSDMAGMVLGSVTHKVLHLARCPVLVVR